MKQYLFKASTLAFFTSTGFFSVLVVLAAVPWAVAPAALGLSELLFAGLYGLIGGYVSYGSFNFLWRYSSTPPNDLAQVARHRYQAVSRSLTLTLALALPFLFLALTGLHTALDFYVEFPKFAYPSILLSILFVPLTAGGSFTYPIAIHLEHRLGILWAAAILKQLPTLFQLAVIYFIADAAMKVKRRGWPRKRVR